MSRTNLSLELPLAKDDRLSFAKRTDRGALRQNVPSRPTAAVHDEVAFVDELAKATVSTPSRKAMWASVMSGPAPRSNFSGSPCVCGVPQGNLRLRGGLAATIPAAGDNFKSVQRIAQFLPVLCQPISDFRRDRRVVLAINEPFAFQQAQTLGQHLGRNTSQLPFQNAESERPVPSQGPQDVHCPRAHKDAEHCFDGTRWLMGETCHGWLLPGAYFQMKSRFL